MFMLLLVDRALRTSLRPVPSVSKGSRAFSSTSSGRVESGDVGSGSLIAPLLHLDVLIDQWFLVQDGFATVAAPLPGRHVGDLVVVSQGLAVLGLRLGPEVTATGLAALQGVDAHQLTELDEVGHPAGLFERLVE